MGKVVLTEECTWRCTCQSPTYPLKTKCAAIRLALAKLDCVDALVWCIDFEYEENGAMVRHFRIKRAVSSEHGADSVYKLRALANGTWRLEIEYCVEVFERDMTYTLFLLRTDPDHDGSIAPLSLAFGGLLFSGPQFHLPSRHLARIVSDVTRAAESFGLTYRNVVRCPGAGPGNLLHKWCTFWNAERPDNEDVARVLLGDMQAVVEPHEYRQMLNERDASGETPYDIVARILGATSPTARLFQPTGPKSAAGAV